MPLKKDLTNAEIRALLAQNPSAGVVREIAKQRIIPTRNKTTDEVAKEILRQVEREEGYGKIARSDTHLFGPPDPPPSPPPVSQPMPSKMKKAKIVINQYTGEEIVLSKYDQELIRVQDAVASFPPRFGLRAFPGKTFTISAHDSYVGDAGGRDAGKVVFYVFEVDEKGKFHAFTKGTANELRPEMIIPAGYETIQQWNSRNLPLRELYGRERLPEPESGLVELSTAEPIATISEAYDNTYDFASMSELLMSDRPAEIPGTGILLFPYPGVDVRNDVARTIVRATDKIKKLVDINTGYNGGGYRGRVVRNRDILENRSTEDLTNEEFESLIYKLTDEEFENLIYKEIYRDILSLVEGFYNYVEPGNTVLYYVFGGTVESGSDVPYKEDTYGFAKFILEHFKECIKYTRTEEYKRLTPEERQERYTHLIRDIMSGQESNPTIRSSRQAARTQAQFAAKHALERPELPLEIRRAIDEQASRAAPAPDPRDVAAARKREQIKEAAAKFPPLFGLRAFPGKTFKIVPSWSRIGDAGSSDAGEVILYIFEADEEGKMFEKDEEGNMPRAFGERTVDELRREITAAPAPKPAPPPPPRPVTAVPLSAASTKAAAEAIETAKQMAVHRVVLYKIELYSGKQEQVIVDGTLNRWNNYRWEVNTTERGKSARYVGSELAKSAKNPKELRLDISQSPLKYLYLRLTDRTNREMDLPTY